MNLKRKNATRVMCIYMGQPKRTAGACEIYRGNMPLAYLGNQVAWKTEWDYFGNIWTQYAAYGLMVFIDLIQSHDIFVLPRVYAVDEEAAVGLAAFFALLRDFNKRVIYETDDDYTNEHRVVVNGDAINVASWTDAITVTTPFLADLMRKRTGRPVYVLPNCIDPALWKAGEPPARAEHLQGKVIIGLTGSTTHYGDWIVLKDVLKPLLESNPHAHLIVMGFHPDYLNDLPQTTYLPGLDYLRYTQVIRTCDVILAPVDPADIFNKGKSPIKAVEGMGAKRTLENRFPAGAAVIATNNPIYQLAVKNGETGLLVEHTPQAWQEGLQALLTNAELRRKLQMKGYAWVYKHHDISREWAQWAKAYRRVLEAPPNPTSIPVLTPPER